MTKVTISAEVDSDFGRRLHLEAARRGWSKSEAIRASIRLWFSLADGRLGAVRSVLRQAKTAGIESADNALELLAELELSE